MSDPTRRTRGEELLLARISAAAGRERLGRRLATYAAAAYTTSTAGTARAKALLALVRHVGSAGAAHTRDAARLDLYENGLTVAVKGRIHVVRYDTTSVYRTEATRPGGTAHALTDVDGERVVLRGGPEQGEAPEWWSGIERGVVGARLPRALAALARGERLAFGEVWLTGEEIGWGEVRARWPRVRRLRTGPGAVGLDIDGTWHELGATGSGIPGLLVLRALVEHLGPGRSGERFHPDVNGST
ncbi:hypothetical protein [Streptomyces sp. UNOB3_S3]|uniref:hypothetical protein n=1 Tax=Streptomyces sp. UNOB3_S3 TaxID=2871682 RepID=UPI001E2896B2|nr:hypothetical protein [Streptomyces sp. UNOB3_S3]MCC3774881.1 hypothetical protein [Streptomyces sp. UNOB3_S3]